MIRKKHGEEIWHKSTMAVRKSLFCECKTKVKRNNELLFKLQKLAFERIFLLIQISLYIIYKLNYFKILSTYLHHTE